MSTSYLADKPLIRRGNEGTHHVGVETFLCESPYVATLISEACLVK